MTNILLIEDDSRLSENISQLFSNEGYKITCIDKAVDIAHALSSSEDYSLIIMDRLLNDHDTKTDVKAIKNRWPASPLMILSAINTPVERTDLLNLGADDYLGKPFMSLELVARVKALNRRASVAPKNYRKIGNTILDITKRTVAVNDTQEILTTKEYLLLKVLSDDMGRVLNKNQLLEYVWGSDTTVESNVVESTITHLRKRLQQLNASLQIKNMRNAGYWLEE
jgi:two-component system, OmpR family, response regulator